MQPQDQNEAGDSAVVLHEEEDVIREEVDSSMVLHDGGDSGPDLNEVRDKRIYKRPFPWHLTLTKLLLVVVVGGSKSKKQIYI